MKRVAIIASGNELLYGKTADTNSGYISSRLFPLDIRVVMFMVTGDDPVELESAIRHALSASDIVIMTGGLGPTDDDRTIETLRKIYGFSITLDGPSRERMDSLYRKIGMPMTDRDLKMVEIPAGATVLANEKGLAPGFIISRQDKVLIALPGVPAEAAYMADTLVVPFLQKEFGIRSRETLSFRVVGMKESDINEAVLAMGIPLERMEWGMTASEGVTTLTFVTRDGGSIDSDAITGKAGTTFGERYLGPSWHRPEEEVIAILRKRNMTMAAAESCTGGLISKRMTDVPGSSDVFIGSVVAYGNSVKVKHLGVSLDDLERHGAVSPEVASAMASGVRAALGADIGISTTGIAGPAGGSETKPVGTVWFGFADKERASSFTHLISGDRRRVRTWASLIAIENLRSYLKQNDC
ncbi:MAG TPA: CinA family nicotinamide mononucleotide deamidase-related protein [Spirochaetota bacterium]|nr:CinA family nicotinamide mononucleotide deamidase-related protein [Spirochaetota bacterium]HQF07660.1 CinA family nicotinamide mononucleotide deamidase-related protein [Spirochaetota bacterium]HQH96392.1 CinA family nicotinamide mononucleotide deamidase-related protein [Spirochaetota bacterium]